MKVRTAAVALCLLIVSIIALNWPAPSRMQPVARTTREDPAPPLRVVAPPTFAIKSSPAPATTAGTWHLPLPIKAQLPATFDGWMQVTCGKFAAGARPLGAKASPRELNADGSSLYRDAFPGCDVSYVENEYKVEEFITVRENAAATEWSWELDLRGGTLTPRLTPLHSIELTDAQGTPRVRIDPPSGKDAKGKPLNAGEELFFALDGNRLTLKANLKDCALPAVIDPSFSTTGTMAVARSAHSATLLSTGKVLIAGGYDQGAAFKTCEIYDPATRTFSAANSMTVARALHCAVLLADGRVLVASGVPNVTGTPRINSCEIFDPGTGLWSNAAPGGSNNRFTPGPTLVRLNDNRVLAVNEIYDPAGDSWTPLTPAVAVTVPSLALRADGKAMQVGGDSSLTAQVFNPVGDTWTQVADLPVSMQKALVFGLNDGRVLAFQQFDTNTIIYDPGSDAWTVIKFPTINFLMPRPSVGCKLSDGRIFGPSFPSALFDPATSTWSHTAPTPVNQFDYETTCTALQGAQALVAGGNRTQGAAINLAAVFDPNGPDVSIAASPASIVQNESIFFSATGSDPLGGTLTYDYDFGDGTGGPGPNATHTFTSVGVFTVTVTVTAASGKTNSASKVVLVQVKENKPTARFVTSDVVGFAGFPLAFDAIYSTDPQNAIEYYTWDFGDGTALGSGQALSHIFANAGTYTVTLTIKDRDTLISTASRAIVVLEASQQGLFNGALNYTVKWDRTKTSADTLSLTATINVGDATVGNGSEIALEVAGQRFTGTLDGKLRDVNGNVNWQVKANQRKQAFGEADIKVKIKKADLGAGFNAAGAVVGPDPKERVSVAIPLRLELAGRVFELSIPSEFKFGNEGKKASGSGEGP